MILAFEADALDSENYLRSTGTMDSWSHERKLYSLALDIMGEEGLGRWLREQYDRNSSLHGFVTTPSCLCIDGGLLINRLCLYLGGHMERSAIQRPGREVPFYCKCHRILFGALLQALPSTCSAHRCVGSGLLLI